MKSRCRRGNKGVGYEVTNSTTRTLIKCSSDGDKGRVSVDKGGKGVMEEVTVDGVPQPGTLQ